MLYSKVQLVSNEMVRADLETALKLLPEWRLKYALSYKMDIDRYTCAKAFVMLKELLQEYCGISEDLEFSYSCYKKPFLKSYPRIHFNYSHCRKAIICAIGDLDIGVDVETIQYDDNILYEVFNESERAEILNAVDPSIKFTEYWTQKESYLKLLGVGLIGGLDNVLCDAKLHINFKTEVNSLHGFVTTIATYKGY